MLYKGLIQLFCLFAICSCISEKRDVPAGDRYLIIPGKSAEGYNIGYELPGDMPMSVLKEKKSISEIFNIDVLPELRFDSVLYVRDSHALFLKNNKIVAVAGFKTAKRVTSDAVLLSRGIDNFIIYYGNDGLRIVVQGNHRAYIYKDAGIAVFDDNSDNTIDLYLVFK